MTFEIINVVSKSYIEIALWSQANGSLGNIVEYYETKAKTTTGFVGMIGPIYWSGGLQTIPKGLDILCGRETIKDSNTFDRCL